MRTSHPVRRFYAILLALATAMPSAAGNRPREMVSPPLATAMPSPACDRGGQELATGNGAASSSRSQALRAAGIESPQVEADLKAGLEAEPSQRDKQLLIQKGV